MLFRAPWIIFSLHFVDASARKPRVKPVSVGISFFHCVKSTPTECLPVLSGIMPPSLRHELAAKNLAKKFMRDPTHFMHEMLGYEHRLRLPSRHPVYHNLLSTTDDRSKSIDKWRHMWSDSSFNLKHFFELPVADLPIGAHLSRRAWCHLNSLRTGYGRFRTCLEKWGLIDDPTCICSEAPQTAEHILSHVKFSNPLSKTRSSEARAVDSLMVGKRVAGPLR